VVQFRLQINTRVTPRPACPGISDRHQPEYATNRNLRGMRLLEKLSSVNG
jgi:hypothetical protein